MAPDRYAHATTHRGLRKRNEDNYCIEPGVGLYAVADGVGGKEGGELASRLVVHTLAEVLGAGDDEADYTPLRGLTRSPSAEARRRMSFAIHHARRRVMDRARGALSDMGTTLAALLIDDNHVLLAHIGDSRIYRMREGVLEQLTSDHSLWRELEHTGGTQVAEAVRHRQRHVITRAISRHTPGEADFRYEALCPGDRFLLCTDGLSDILGAEEIAGVLGQVPTAEATEELVDRARANGAHDNITALVVSFASSSDEEDMRESRTHVRLPRDS